MPSDTSNNLILINLALLFCSFYQTTITNHTKTSHVIYNITCIIHSILLLILMLAFISSDFSVENVFLFSSAILPLIYKIGAVWSSSQGSMLFFLWIFSAISSIAIFLNKSSEYEIKIFVRLSSIVSFIFLSNIYLFNNPFAHFSSPISQGMGLSPVLQDAALLIHPPILYLGYILLFPPMVLAIVILQKPEYLKINFQKILLWSKLSWGFITIGISLGAWWAYRELGWGGYWFFDPVENASLLPWLMATSLYHSCKKAITTAQLYKTTILFAILGFTAVLISTFFVRSGLLISVHSFANDLLSCFYLLFSSLSFVTYLSILLILNINKEEFKTTGTTAISLVKIGNILLSVAAIIILISLAYPIIFELIWNQKVSLDIKFFINSLLPVFCFIAICASLLYLTLINIIILITLSLIAIFIWFILKLNIIVTLAFVSSATLIIASISMLFKVKITGLQKITKTFLGHFGYGALILFITLNNILQEETQFVGNLGAEINFRNMNIRLNDIKYSKSNNYYQKIANFWITIDQNKHIILSPENRLYEIENSILPEAAIKSFWLYDIYAVLNFSPNEEINATFYYKPYMLFIWLSLAIISIGILL